VCAPSSILARDRKLGKFLRPAMRQQPRRCAPIRLGRVGQDFDVVHPRLAPRVLQRSKSWRKPSSMVRISAMKSKHILARSFLPILVFGCAIFISTVAQGGAGSL